MQRVGIAFVGIALVACGEPRGELREWQPSDHQQPSEAQPSDDREPAEGSADADPEQTERRAATALFRAMCGSCHGEEGHGDGPGRPPVAPIVDLASEEWQASRTDEQIAEAITLGRGGFMPAFGDRLSAPGIAALVRHVRRIGGRETGADTGAGAGADTGAGAGTDTGAGAGADTGAGGEPASEAGGAGGGAGESGAGAP